MPRADVDPKDIGTIKPPVQEGPASPDLKGQFDQREFSELSKGYEQGIIGENAMLEAKVAKLAAEKPELRKYLLPLLRKARQDRGDIAAFRIASTRFPKVITAKRWLTMTNIEKVAVLRKTASKPLMENLGLNKEKVRAGEALMMYMISREANHSKFYEAIILPSGMGFIVRTMYGGLTDSPGTGRVVTKDYPASSMDQAKRMLQAIYQKRLSPGHDYIDAFDSSTHRSPQTGKALPPGEYPIGLARNVGFGWGTQSVSYCIPALKNLQDAIAAAQDEIANQGRSETVKFSLTRALDFIKAIANEDSTMGQKLVRLMSRPLRRVTEGKQERFLPDPDGRAMAADLRTLATYIEKQMSYCK